MLKEKDFEFQIIGDGPYKTKLESLVKEQHLENKVVFLGTRYDVSQLLEKADIFVHVPIIEEGFGITIVEAMASGKLCICSNSGAISEIIENDGNGFLVNEKIMLSN